LDYNPERKVEALGIFAKDAEQRTLTPGERALASSVFGAALDAERVRLVRRCWIVWQPKTVCIVPDGRFYFHPRSTCYAEDYSQLSLSWQGFFIHELTHAWQHQAGLAVVWRRGFWARYAYLPLEAGRPFERYGIEQQAEIVRHAFLIARGAAVPGAPPLEVYQRLLPFREGPASKAGPLVV
jgi:hypothetical protein